MFRSASRTSVLLDDSVYQAYSGTQTNYQRKIMSAKKTVGSARKPKSGALLT